MKVIEKFRLGALGVKRAARGRFHGGGIPALAQER